MHRLDKKIITVAELLAEPALAIPSYQRPYKWTQKNLTALLDDLRLYRDKSAYRLGTVVFHCHNANNQEQLDIVDGQQRTLTLTLLVKAILDERLKGLIRTDLKAQLNRLATGIDSFIERQAFNSNITHLNLHQNFMAAKRAVSRSDFTEADVDFLLNRCELVTFVLHNVSEAFQFFDSQNARGKDLEPHDLLKAFHLREFSQEESNLKGAAVSNWENLESNALSKVFANYLFRIRNWSQGKSAQYFNKSKVGIFKGVNLDQVGAFPYVESLRIAHHFVDNYNSQYERSIDRHKMQFPFHLDQMIINGRRFFEMTDHYQAMIANIIDDENRFGSQNQVRLLGVDLTPLASKIIHTLNTYPERTRTGDKFIRTLFDCALIFYIDKFGDQNLSEAVEKLFIWAYSCRLEMYRVQIETMDNHARKKNAFERIKLAIQPSDFLNWPLATIKETDIKGTNLGVVIKLFKEMKYYE